MAGNARRRGGLMLVFGEESGDGRKWRGYQAQYRQVLYGVGEETEGQSGRTKRAGPSSKAPAAVQGRGGTLSVAKVVRVRVRYFTQSVAFGSREWVEGLTMDGLEAWRRLIDLRG